jgi:hypothetical protein
MKTQHPNTELYAHKTNQTMMNATANVEYLGHDLCTSKTALYKWGHRGTAFGMHLGIPRVTDH